jgi:hypothetical protein
MRNIKISNPQLRTHLHLPPDVPLRVSCFETDPCRNVPVSSPAELCSLEDLQINDVILVEQLALRNRDDVSTSSRDVPSSIDTSTADSTRDACAESVRGANEPASAHKMNESSREEYGSSFHDGTNLSGTNRSGSISSDAVTGVGPSDCAASRSEDEFL